MMGLWPLCSSVQRASALQILTHVKKEFRIGSHLATLSTLSGDKPVLQNCRRHGGARACQRINKSSFSSPSYLLIHSKGCANVSSNLTLPPLMDAPPIMWPKLINTIRNWIFTVFVIRPHMDREFSLTEFDKGARQAMSFISEKLSKGEFDDLEDVVDADALAEIKKNMAGFSMAQRELLAVDPEDIFFSFPFEIGIIIPDNQPEPRFMEDDDTSKKPAQVRHVEITYVFHVLRGMAKDQDLANKTFKEFIAAEETKRRVMVCNYRFFRDFTEGKDPKWIVNMVNHFLPAELPAMTAGQR